MDKPDGSLRYVVCYDIPNDRRRVRLARRLDDFGARVQYSVFEMLLDHPLFDKMVQAIQNEIDPSEDRVHIYPMCAGCEKKAVFLGLARDEDRPGLEVAFIV
jgi:CRISPR-associated protein Cas2